MCETSTIDENEDGDATAEQEYEREQGKALGHDGCGQEQPSWRKEGLKLSAVIKPPPVEKGEVRLSWCLIQEANRK
jgi:DNA-directed RNA polymerase II subunit RPB1